MSATIDGRLFESLRADEVQSGDTVYVAPHGLCVAYWVGPKGESQVELFLGTTSDLEFKDLGERVEWNSNPVWVSAYDARVTGRRPGDCWGSK